MGSAPLPARGPGADSRSDDPRAWRLPRAARRDRPTCVPTRLRACEALAEIADVSRW